VTPIENNPALLPPGNVGAPSAPAGSRSEQAPGKASDASFSDALAKAGAQQQLQFSRHALARVQRRGIEVDQSTLTRLAEGVNRAAGKGSRDSLVLVDGTAFVVSVANRTVITAVGSQHMKDNVFTNIDSAVIA
jgi:flagellar operon protein